MKPILTGLENRVALVTGAARGNGAAIARGLARAGATVVIADLDGEGAQGTARDLATVGLRAHAYSLDVTDAAACEALARRCEREVGPIAYLVNNAGVLLRGGIDDPGEAAAWARTLDVNVNGAHNVTMACLAQLRRARGAIVNVSSIHAFVAPGASAAYSASKGAIAQYTKALAGELAAHGVRVNAIAPGIIRTPMTEVTTSDPARLEAFLRHVPMRRVGEPEELAGPVLFLLSDAASYVSGAVLPVDGAYLTQ
jgi:NAD(P)-dependent dehydrogenase (short-subunit alcohol dehydrogenase family)